MEVFLLYFKSDLVQTLNNAPDNIIKLDVMLN